MQAAKKARRTRQPCEARAVDDRQRADTRNFSLRFRFIRSTYCGGREEHADAAAAARSLVGQKLRGWDLRGTNCRDKGLVDKSRWELSNKAPTAQTACRRSSQWPIPGCISSFVGLPCPTRHIWRILPDSQHLRGGPLTDSENLCRSMLPFRQRYPWDWTCVYAALAVDLLPFSTKLQLTYQEPTNRKTSSNETTQDQPCRETRPTSFLPSARVPFAGIHSQSLREQPASPHSQPDKQPLPAMTRYARNISINVPSKDVCTDVCTSISICKGKFLHPSQTSTQ